MLCTPSKSYQLRQVQTSNSLFVTKPALEAHGNEIPTPVTRAIASCTATLELHPSEASAELLLREQLPVYDIVAGDVDATGNGRNQATVFEDLPLSDGECQEAWNRVYAFEHDNSSFQPSAGALLHVWKSIMAAALADGIKLHTQFLTDDITRAVSEEGHPSGLIEAILEGLSTDGQDTSGPWSCLDQVKTVAFTGKMILEAKTDNDFLIADFTDTWQDQLPDVWRKDAQLSAIEEVYNFPTDTTIRAKSKGTATNSSTASTTAAKPSARKWHEKFGKTRKK